IVRCINCLSELENEAKWSSNPRILLEVALVKMCRVGEEKSLEGILTRLSKLEECISKGSFSLKAADKPKAAGQEAKREAAVKKERSTAGLKETPASNPDSGSIIEKWPGFIQEMKVRGKIRLRTYLAMAKPVKAESGIIVLSFEKEGVFSKEALELSANRADVEEAASQYFGTPLKIKCIISGEDEEDEQDSIVKAAIEFAGMDKVEVVEEEEE
ncbi:MAG TPA: hypothetical protein P5021_00355, partial [Candidatus Diapherotrites archaeon]|nr:hypothetical protein [Candidatus Diapherotrites archaeon]